MKIEFSKNGEGRMILTPRFNVLEIYKIKSGKLKIREDLTNKKYETELLAELVFYKVESIDAFIDSLERVKAEIIRLSAV